MGVKRAQKANRRVLAERKPTVVGERTCWRVLAERKPTVVGKRTCRRVLAEPEADRGRKTHAAESSERVTSAL